MRNTSTVGRRRRHSAAAAALGLSLAVQGVASLGCSEWPDKVYLLRHAEKASDGSSDSALTPKGWCMAGALPGTLKGEKITAIFVTDKKRTRQTAMSLSRYAGVEPTILPQGDNAALLTAICDAGKARETEAVIVVGHTTTIPEIMEGLGVQGKRPKYGDLFVVDPSAVSMDSARYGEFCP